MAILSITPVIIGNVGDSPRQWKILTDNTYSEVTTAGFLSSFQSTYNFVNSDYAEVYTTDLLVQQLNITVSGSVVSLVNTADSSLITYPVIANHIAVFSSTSSSSSTIKDDVAIAINGGDIQAGLDATAGKLRSYPSTTATGYLEVYATSSSGDYNVGLTNAAFGQSSVIRIPDPGAATAKVLLDSGSNVLATGGIIRPAKVNGTESANAVTASGAAGVITTSSLTTAAAGSYAITWTNTLITSSSVITVTPSGGTNTRRNFQVYVVPGSGNATITIYNTEPTNALNGTILLSYSVC